MAQVTLYYVSLLILFAFLGIFNIVQYSRYSDTPCLKTVTTQDTTTGATTTSVEESSLDLVKLPTVIGILYLINTGLSFIASVVLWYISDRPSKRFSSLGFFFRCFGFMLRISFPLMTLLHLVILILVLVQFYMLYGNDPCSADSTIVENNKKRDDMIHDGKIANIVTIIVWLIIHVLGPRLKKWLFIDPFIYEPLDPDRNKAVQFCCTTIGV